MRRAHRWLTLGLVMFVALLAVVLVMALAMVILMVFPEIATWLPDWYYGR